MNDEPRMGYPLGTLGIWLSKTPVTSTKGADGPRITELENEVNNLFKANADMWIDGLKITGGLTSAQIGVLFHAGNPYPNSIRMGDSYLWLSNVDSYQAAKENGDEPMALLEAATSKLFHENPLAKLATWQLTGGRGSALIAILSYVEPSAVAPVVEPVEPHDEPVDE